MSKTAPNPTDNGHRDIGGKKLYELHFRRGNRPPEVIVFEFNGDHQSAINKGREHCEKMDERFLGVYPFCVDLDARLQYRQKEIAV